MIVSMAAYLVIDLSVRMTGLVRYSDAVGVKNFLAVLLGLVFGPWGAGGCCLGCFLGSVFLNDLDIYTLYECLADLIVGNGMWCLWHLRNKNGTVFLKKPVDYGRYLVMLLFLSCIAGLAAYVILPERDFIPYFGAYFILGIIVGIPILILMTSIICVEPFLPYWRKRNVGISGTVTSAPETLTAFNEQLEEYALGHKIKMKETRK